MAFFRPWADLPDDVLKTLVAYLLPNFFDILSFEAVCKSWRAATAALVSKEEKIPHRPRGPSLPCLTFRAVQEEPAGGGGGGDEATAASVTTTRCFHSLANDRVYGREAPGESRDWHCWVSSHGWLLMMDLHGAAFLFNPITGARVGVPPLTTLPGVVRIGRRKRDGAPLYIFLSPLNRADPERRKADRFYRFTADDLRPYLVWKLALSSSPLDPGCVALVTHSGYRTLAYARPGDESWTELENPWTFFKDVIYHDKEGRFYALSNTAGVVAIDFPSSRVAPPHHDDGRLPQPTVKLVAPKAPCSCISFPKNEYLVALPSGEILQVCRYVGDDDDDDDDDHNGGDDDDSDPEYELGNEDHEYSSQSESEYGDYVFPPYRTANFKVFLMNAGGEGKKKKKQWVQLHSIGECSLFLGFNQSMSLPASGESMGKYRPNCIYFSDDMRVRSFGKPYEGHDCGIFEIGKQTLEFFFPPDAPRIIPRPMWIMPDRGFEGGKKNYRVS